MFKDCSFDQLEEAKARMGISKYKAELFSKLIALESKTAEWHEKKKMDNSRGIIDTLLSIRKSKDREDAISLAESLGIQEPKEMEDFLKNLSFIIGNFPEVIRIHFNTKELPYSKTIGMFLLLYPTEDRIMAAVDKLNTVPYGGRMSAATQFLRLLKGIDPDTGEIRPDQACPELLDLVSLPSFPYDETMISAIIRFRGLFPENPEKLTTDN